jgi:hypothetical protein
MGRARRTEVSKVNAQGLMTRKLTAAVAAFALVLAGMTLLLAVNASSASAQLPAICQQYPDLPQCQEPTGPTGPTGAGPTGPTGIGPTTDEGPTAGVTTGGELPFTGYPLTGLILLLLVLLLAGLAIRTYLAVRGRITGSE